MLSSELSEPAQDRERIRAALREHLHALPVLPTAVARLMSLNPRAESYFDDVVEIIEHEPNYAVKLLSHANSVTMRSQKPITKIRDAVVRIGAKGASGLVLALAVARVFVPTHPWETGLWLHAIHVGALSRCLARVLARPDLDPEVAYLAGLLHDVGRFILFNEAPNALKHVDEASWATPREMLAAETQICGIDHTELGAHAAESWCLPHVIVEVIRNHHTPATRRDATSMLIGIVQVADEIAFRYLSPEHSPGGQPVPSASLSKLLPPWYPVQPEAATAAMQTALEESKADANLLMPWAKL